MNQKKAKQLRKALAAVPAQGADVTLHSRYLLNGIPHLHQAVNPITYPVGSRRRMYQDAKRGRASISGAVAAGAQAANAAAERKAA